jgi:uncharacterized phage infection (PIP) family protein YhgE
MKKYSLKLKELIVKTVIPDIEDRLDEIFADIAKSKKATDAQNEEIQEINEMRDEFNIVLKDIENSELSEEECTELFEDITEMIREMEEED